VFSRPSKQGFDIIIGNPPYIDSENMVNLGLSWEREQLQDRYSTLSGNWDIYMAFLEFACVNSKIAAYITPDKWLSMPFGLKFREKFMISKLSSIVHCGSKVFNNATVDSIITIFNVNPRNTSVYIFDKEKSVKMVTSENLSTLLTPYFIDYLFSENKDLIVKINSIKTNLKDLNLICEDACATKDAYELVPYIYSNKNFNAEKEFKLINTGTIGHYQSLWDKKEIVYLKKETKKPSIPYPVINKSDFESMGKTYKKRSYSPKIIFKSINILDAFIDFDSEYVPGKATRVICSKEINLLKYVCSLLNSKLIAFYIGIMFKSCSYCGGIKFTQDIINALPIPTATPAQQQEIITLVDKILATKKTDSSADTTALESKIDQLVYKLYNLTDEEIKIVEEK